jgi:hypothetical protein
MLLVCEEIIFSGIHLADTLEDGGCTILRKIGNGQTEYIALHFRSQHSSYSQL